MHGRGGCQEERGTLQYIGLETLSPQLGRRQQQQEFFECSI